jgi:hypothetical protein
MKKGCCDMKKRKFNKGDVLRLEGKDTVRKEHELKTWPESFNAIKDGRKTFDVRRADRDFQEGDVLILQEFIPCGHCRGTGFEENIHMGELKCCKKPHGKYTGRRIVTTVTFVYKGGQFGIMDTHVVLGLGLACEEHEVSTKKTKGKRK